MAVATVQKVSGTTSGSGTTKAVSFSGGVNASSVLVAVVGSQNSGGAFASVSGAGATWTKAGGIYSSSQAVANEIWVGTSPTASSTGPVTATTSGSALGITMIVYEVSGLLSGSVTNGPLTQAWTGGSTVTGPSLSTYPDGLVVASQVDGGDAFSSYSDSPSGWLSEDNIAGSFNVVVAGLYAPTGVVNAQQAVVYGGSFGANAVIVEIGGTTPPPAPTFKPGIHGARQAVMRAATL